jgi:hypothetical protein
MVNYSSSYLDRSSWYLPHARLQAPDQSLPNHGNSPTSPRTKGMAHLTERIAASQVCQAIQKEHQSQPHTVILAPS